MLTIRLALPHTTQRIWVKWYEPNSLSISPDTTLGLLKSEPLVQVTARPSYGRLAYHEYLSVYRFSRLLSRCLLRPAHWLQQSRMLRSKHSSRAGAIPV